jgi:hypothetical protein
MHAPLPGALSRPKRRDDYATGRGRRDGGIHPTLSAMPCVGTRMIVM